MVVMVIENGFAKKEADVDKGAFPALLVECCLDHKTSKGFFWLKKLNFRKLGPML
jgi:hypothetical protein